MLEDLCRQLDVLIRRDPAGRGLIGSDSRRGVLCAGHLEMAARELAAKARRATIVTGFFVPDGEPPAAETDGPPGAVVLALALNAVGCPTRIATDGFCEQAIRVAARAGGLEPDSVTVCSQNDTSWLETFFTEGPGKGLTHLIAIERVGPSHCEESLRRQECGDGALRRSFLSAVPIEHRDRCHNMRGTVIDASTAPLHRLFEIGPRDVAGLKTIGIGDGGNEIGMGSIAWTELASRLPGAEAARTFCRVPTDWNIVAGTSNWGGFALAAALLAQVGRTDSLKALDEGYHLRMLEEMVAQGPAVDGITRRQAATVDGLPFATYIQTWIGIRRLLGFGG